MKTSLAFACMMLLTLTTWATVRTVSNNPATIGQFSTIQSALDASVDGDTVYVYGSPNTYAAFTILDKKIAVIGPGWAPDKNLPHTAKVNGAVLRNSAAPGSPDGSELHGLVFLQPVTASRNQVNGSDIPVNNIRIIRCQFSQSLNWDFSSSGFLIEGCAFYYNLSFHQPSTYENFLFQNNMFYHGIGSSTFTQINYLTNSVNVRFDHNLFYSPNNGGGGAYAIFGANCRFLSFTNNIFNQANAGLSVSFSTFSNNITNNITLAAGNAVSNATPWSVNDNVDGGGNVANGNPGMADQTAVNAGTANALLNFTIASGAANNSGSDGKDMGLLYDAIGSLNWANSRSSRLPRIFSMNITNPTITPGGSLNVTVDARKSN